MLPCTHDEFIVHLNKCSKEVSTWPKWKQEMLGGTASSPSLETIIISKLHKINQELESVINLLKN